MADPASQPARTRVLLLLPSLHGGGAERVAMLLMKHVDATRFDLRMGLLRKSGPYVAELDEARLDVARLGARFMDFDRGNAEVYRPGHRVHSRAWHLSPRTRRCTGSCAFMTRCASVVS